MSEGTSRVDLFSSIVLVSRIWGHQVQQIFQVLLLYSKGLMNLLQLLDLLSKYLYHQIFLGIHL